MSPEEIRSVAALQRLRHEIAVDARSRADRHGELAEVLASPPESRDRAVLVFLAALIHAWYTGLETSIERILRQLDREVPRGDRWHQEMLRQASVPIPGIRPAVLPPDFEADLDEILRFRHFFRHAYGLELDPGRVAAEAQRLAGIHRKVVDALDDFDAFLAETIDRLAGG